MIDLQRLKDGEVSVNSTEVIDLHTIIQEQVISQIRHLAIPPFEDDEADSSLGKLKCKDVSSLINDVCRSIDKGIITWANKQMEKYANTNRPNSNSNKDGGPSV
jgi:hypothetical protein